MVKKRLEEIYFTWQFICYYHKIPTVSLSYSWRPHQSWKPSLWHVTPKSVFNFYFVHLQQFCTSLPATPAALHIRIKLPCSKHALSKHVVLFLGWKQNSQKTVVWWWGWWGGGAVGVLNLSWAQWWQVPIPMERREIFAQFKYYVRQLTTFKYLKSILKIGQTLSPCQ
jgi:hypothetical protein